MRTKIIVFVTAFAVSAQTVFAEMELFIGAQCPHCQRLQEEMEKRGFDEKFPIQTYEVYNNVSNRDYYVYKAQLLGYSGGQVPLLVDGVSYVDGTNDILSYLEDLTPAENQPQPKNTLTETDSQRLNDLLKGQNPLPDAPEPEEIAEEPSNRNVKIIGTLAILFGLTLFTTIIWRARRRK